MQPDIDVTVICPIRNERAYIVGCLTSLLTQTFPGERTEILVVDGMSDDGTRTIVQEMAGEHPNLILLDNPRRIVPCALNIGIARARGRFIVRIDGHAKAAPDFLEKTVQALSESDAQCVGGPIISINSDETGKSIAAAMSSPFGVGNAHFRTPINRQRCVDTVAFPGFRREVFAQIGHFDEELVRCQDDEFNFRIRSNGGKILLTPSIRSWYFPRANLKKLWRQYYGYGLWKVRVFQKHPGRMQPRHFIPSLFVLSLFLPLTAGFIYPFIWVMVAAIAAAYGSASLWAALRAAKRHDGTDLKKVLLSFYILHFSYGIGFLWGLVHFFPRWWRHGSPAPVAVKLESVER